MATRLTINLNGRQEIRALEALGIHNAETREGLTLTQFVELGMSGQIEETIMAAKNLTAQAEADLATVDAAERTAIRDDLKR